MTRSPLRPPTDRSDPQRAESSDESENSEAAPASAAGIRLDARVALAANGDRQAAQSLLLELLPRVRNLVRYLIRGDADVDDITQVVLLELLKSFGSYQAKGSLKAWADRITVRVTLRRHKQSAHQKERMTEAAAELQVVEPRTSSVDEYLVRRKVVRVLDDIPLEQRHAVVLHHVVGLSVPELAAELGVPGETVRSRLRLGISKLRAHPAFEDER